MNVVAKSDLFLCLFKALLRESLRKIKTEVKEKKLSEGPSYGLYGGGLKDAIYDGGQQLRL